MTAERDHFTRADLIAAVRAARARARDEYTTPAGSTLADEVIADMQRRLAELNHLRAWMLHGTPIKADAKGGAT